MISAVLFDLDDTLFPQSAWLDGAWTAVARAGAEHGVDHRRLRHALVEIASEGTARGRIIDRALAAIGAADVPIDPLISAFRSHRPTTLPCYAGAAEALAELRDGVPLGLVTDGDVDIQRAKLHALGLDGAFDAIVLSDALGRELRKPHGAPFLRAVEELGVTAAATAFVGDHPEKDVEGSMLVGMRAVRVRTGEYGKQPSRRRPWMEVANVVEAVERLRPLLTRRIASRG